MLISDMYDKAKANLWCTNLPGWHRNETDGLFYMWQSYHMAISESTKDDLIWARILVMMYRENRCGSDYERFNAYVKPAYMAYKNVLENGTKISEKEINEIEFLYNSLEYDLKRTDDSPEELETALNYIAGIESVQDFQFHDSRIIRFEHDEDTATLVFKYDEVIVTIKFYDVYDIRIDCDPKSAYVTEYYCYPQFHNSDRYIFDVGFYRINCKKIEVVKVW